MISTTSKMIKLSGKIENYRVTRKESSFVFTNEELGRFYGIATVAAISGLAGQAVSLSAAASDANEMADYVEFDLDGVPVKGWLWRSPFSVGDEVVVAARLEGNYVEAIGIARPSDRTVALYPHCSRGAIKHYINSGKLWIIGTVISLLLGGISGLIVNGLHATVEMYTLGNGAIPLIILAMAGFITIRVTFKWMKFVHIAESVFSTLGWINPRHIDLVKSSKRKRLEIDPPEYGMYYFRY